MDFDKNFQSSLKQATSTSSNLPNRPSQNLSQQKNDSSTFQDRNASGVEPAVKRQKPLIPMITRDQYIDYDFSTIRDTNGGFLYDPKLDPQAPGSLIKERAPILIKDIRKSALLGNVLWLNRVSFS